MLLRDDHVYQQSGISCSINCRGASRTLLDVSDYSPHCSLLNIVILIVMARTKELPHTTDSQAGKVAVMDTGSLLIALLAVAVSWKEKSSHLPQDSARSSRRNRVLKCCRSKTLKTPTTSEELVTVREYAIWTSAGTLAGLDHVRTVSLDPTSLRSLGGSVCGTKRNVTQDMSIT